MAGAYPNSSRHGRQPERFCLVGETREEDVLFGEVNFPGRPHVFDAYDRTLASVMNKTFLFEFA